MRIPKSIRDNLRFLVAEVISQLGNLQVYFSSGAANSAHRILDRSGYAYNLKVRIHSSCISCIAQCRQRESDTLSLRAVESIATDLERITELSRDCLHQMAHLRQPQTHRVMAYVPLIERLMRGIGMIESALSESDTGLALKIGRIEQKLDHAYKKWLRRHTAELRHGKHTKDLISVLFVAHHVEQMGDALLSISEAIISANLGQTMDMGRYHSLKHSVEQLGSEENLSGLVVEPIAETRSGSAISGIGSADKEAPGYVAIFKDGKKQKVKEEREGVESWHEIFPGLAPRILSYHKRGQSAALLIEHLAGLTFEQIVLHEPSALIKQTLDKLCATLESVWRETHCKKPVSAHYIKQLANRLDEVYAIHPEFRQSDSQVCGLKIASFDRLLERAETFESQLQAPFSVYIHGDFNADNILYDPLEKKINFIDLHRSRYMDYVQDVSVFMVSNYRLQILDAPRRARIMALCRDFYRFANVYARQIGDPTFELRLALGLARSFATSTRFILDKSLARAMFLRARYLLEWALAAPHQQTPPLSLPIKEIFIA
jgi:phosphate uptake regulator/aminoglycoside phosphotransferase (APT) family kinase protein